MEELKTRSFRITDDTSDKIKELAGEIGGNQQEVIAKLIEAYEFQKGKTILTTKKGDVEKFEQYLSILTRMYMGSLEENQNMTETIYTEFESQLRSKDFTIKNLQEENIKLKQDKSSVLTNTKVITEENNSLRKQLEADHCEAEEKKHAFENMLKDKEELNRALISSVNEIKSRTENMESKLSSAEETIRLSKDLESRLKAREQEKTELEKELQSIKKQYEEMSAKTTQEAERNHENVMLKHEIKHEKELLEQEKIYQEILQKLKTEHQEEIDQYQKKYFDLLQTVQTHSTEAVSKTKTKTKETPTKQNKASSLEQTSAK